MPQTSKTPPHPSVAAPANPAHSRPRIETRAPFRLALCALAVAFAFGAAPPAPASGSATASAKTSASSITARPALMLASPYHSGIRLSDWWVSEKYDGVRGYWDGEKLMTRGGERIAAPAWFTAGWPREPMDGELWVARGRFLEAVSTVRQKVPNEAQWRALRFMLFDLPGRAAPFTERNAALAKLVEGIGQSWLRHVAQSKVAGQAELRAMMAQVVAQGGEGLALHRGDAFPQTGRSGDLLKFKPYEDGEAKVVGHLPGKGKYAGMLGALEVESPDGLRFRLGSGLGDGERRQPPPLGAWITYRFNGTHEKTGLPRFPRFLRLREDYSPEEE